MTEAIERRLNKMDEIFQRKTETLAEIEQLKAQVITDEIQEALDAIDVEFSEKLSQITEQEATLVSQIKTLTLEHGETVQTDTLQAVISTRKNWDMAGLKAHAVSNPKLNAFKKADTTFVSIKPRNKK